MSRISTSIAIKAPREAVWEVLNDLHRNPDWVANVQGVLSVSEGPVGIDTVFRERIRLFGPFHAEGEWRITRCEPPSVHEHRGMMLIIGPATVTYSLQGENGGCRCVAEVSCGQGRGPLYRALDALFIKPGLALSFQRNLRNLKRLVESGLPNG